MVFGPCNKETKQFFFFESLCTSEDHEILSADEIECQRCKTIHMARTCPQCNESVPVAKFKQKTMMDRLKGKD